MVDKRQYASSKTWILYIYTTTKKLSWLDKHNLKNVHFEKKCPKVKNMLKYNIKLKYFSWLPSAILPLR